MSFFYVKLTLAINFLRQVLANQKEILKREHELKLMLQTIRATQVQQGKQLTTILEEVTPPQPGETVSLAFVFGDLSSES